MRIVHRILALLVWPLRFLGRTVSRAGAALLPRLRPSRIRITVSAGRSAAAPWWRRGTRSLIVLLGLGVYFGLQFGLAQLIQNENWYGIGTIVVLTTTVLLTLYSPPSAFMGWLILSPWVMLFWVGTVGGYLPVTFDRLALLLILIVVVVRLLANRWPMRRLTLPEILLFGSYFWIKLTPYIGTRPPIIYIAAIILEAVVMPFFIYFIAKMCIRKKEQVAGAAVAIVMMGLLWALTGYYEHFYGKMWLSSIVGYDVRLTMTDVARGRAMGPTFHMYVYGGVLTLTILMAMHLAGQTRKIALSIFYYAVVAITVVGLYWGFARGAYLAFLAVSVLLPIFASTNRVRYLIYVFVLIVGISLMLPYVMASRDVANRMQNKANVFYRLVAYHTLWNMIKGNFWTGVGFGNSEEEVPKYLDSFGYPVAKQSKTGLRTYSHGHNEYLTVFAEQGVIGFVAYFGAVVGSVIQMLRMRRHLPAEGVAGRDFITVCSLFVIAYLILCMSDRFKVPAYAYINFVVWSVIGLGIRLGELGEEEARAAKAPPLQEPAAASVA
jgi:O-antigen ligase